MSEHEQEVLLDLTQLTFDIAGIFDPTPIADGTNTAISLARRDWLGAGLSAVSMVPYVGDLAKAGKFGRWAQTVHAAVELAARNSVFARAARPLLRKLAALLDDIPPRLLPANARGAVAGMRRRLQSVLGLVPARGLIEDLAATRKQMFAFIDDMQLRPPGKDLGVLWSRIGEKDVVDGAVLAAGIAGSKGQKTLEMSLQGTGFEAVYQATKEKLMRQHGLTEAQVWESFGRDAWQRASLRYAGTLEGRVSAYVRFTPTRAGQSGISIASGPYDPLKDPILFDELEAIAEAMLQNPKITSVKLISIDTAEFKLLEREQLLRAARTTH